MTAAHRSIRLISMSWVRALAILMLAAVLAATCGGPNASVGLESTIGPVRLEPARPPSTPTTQPAPTTPTTPTTDIKPTTSTTSPRRRVTLTFTGDVLLHNRVNAQAFTNAENEPEREYDYRPLLEPIRPLVADADWAVCHLEVNLSADNTRLQPFPTFRAPGQIASDLRDLGYDSCSVASNHVIDHGAEGVAETLTVLDAAGLGSTGAARSASEAAQQIWIEVGSVRIAHLSYAYGFNGFAPPADSPWLANVIDEAQIITDASRARAAGADFVMLSLHWGEQYVEQPNWQQRELGPRLLASPDIDLIIGHHAHVVQPIDYVEGEWLVNGLGNLLANAPRPTRRDELLVQVTLTEQLDGQFSVALRAVPLYIDYETLTVHPSNPRNRPRTTDPTLAAELDASWQRVQDVLQSGSGWESLELG